MKSSPLVSVVIPTYNYSQFIGEAIDSVFSSSLSKNELEIIVVDDGSTDNTADKIQAYPDEIIYIQQKNSGKAKATKVGIDRSTGKYLFNLDADDIFLPEKLEKVVNCFESDRDLVHVSHPAIYWDVNNNAKESEPIPEWMKNTKLSGKELLRYFYRHQILFGGGSTFATRTEIAKKIPIPEAVDMYIDEHLVLFALQDKYCYFIDEPLSLWRIHGSNFSVGESKSKKAIAKLKRSQSSMAAVLKTLEAEEFEPEIIALYALKTKVSIASIKEQLGQKSLGDIMDIWQYLWQNFSQDPELLQLVKTYNVLNRTLPTPIINGLRTLKSKLSRHG
ncbi:MAG: glycosyltransferase family 2 protein [Roseofilum sp. SBFL]|uniref:glycosyltransferase family 2 protein n=1 Tax=unclassified Roseofilum TaxID=2620099 RepID=UPI001B13D245|nr:MULTISPECIES: glycosyltransferase family 2 protein [unclassified Roseofilum]MBP0014387.1 glycosyltransferase family 2 protein [Roseofilum sp. SID3]MBP0025952.1 glycosyltransferase family 2 protein [Roseofilum sp. SID2]MBP0036124.1 glycosyltransferase family 2 protein [Roseofilum sp. SID1]MBP0040492.1 glycosyltransferase family 2 protein [Roseofilum sp. SBFL]